MIKSYNICFLGTTGHGKSSLINALFGTKFATDPTYSCTKELYTATKITDDIENYEAVCVWDTPGIEEQSYDLLYGKFYEHAIMNADCIVLVLTMMRTDKKSQILALKIAEILKSKEKDTRLFIALNQIDLSSVRGRTEETYWNHKTNEPSTLCLQNVEKRIREIHKKFDHILDSFQIVATSVHCNYNIQKLYEIITQPSNNDL